jgi:ABC-type lipoprotein release transport system permease subunit
MIITMALRQLLANKKRTVVTLLLSTFATALLIFANAISDGSHNQLIRSSVEVYPGYIEITHRDYVDEPGLDHLLVDAQSLKQRVLAVEGVQSAAIRFETFALYAGETRTIGGMFTGIEPSSEAGVSRLKGALQEGEYLSDRGDNALYVGVELARRLGVGVGDVLAFISTGADYSFAADNLEITGVFKTRLYEFDNASAFVSKAYFDRVMNARGYATHLIVQPENIESADAVAAEIRKVLGSDVKVRSYTESMADLVKAMEIDEIFGYITLGIFFIVIFFVIAIFAFLSVFGRIRELGVLRALGTTPSQVAGMLIAEALILGVLSVGLGGAAGAYASHHYEKHPITIDTLFGMDVEEYSKQYNIVAESTIPALFDPQKIIVEMIIMLLLNLLSVIYPVMMVNRFTPTEAMRHV